MNVPQAGNSDTEADNEHDKTIMITSQIMENQGPAPQLPNPHHEIIKMLAALKLVQIANQVIRQH